LLEDEMISIVKDYAFENSTEDDIHGFPHTMRVYKLCLRIGNEKDVNHIVLKIAALLHDIGRIKEDKKLQKRNHAELSAEMALSFINAQEFQLSHKAKTNIIHSIRAHSFSNNVGPDTLEAKILSDADKLDALGAVGLYRTIGFTLQNQGGIKQVISHLENKILKLKDNLFLDNSKMIAKQRHSIVLDFYDKIAQEIHQ
jgi:uncharacterized protein